MSASSGIRLAYPQNVAGQAAQAGQYYDCAGGLYVFSASSTAWGGTTATLVVLGPDGATPIAAGVNTTLTANGMATVYLPPCSVAVVVTGGANPNLYATLARVVS